MTDNKPDNNDSRIDAFLDHLLTEDEQELFLRESESRQELSSAMELQTRIDESLRRVFSFKQPKENLVTEITRPSELAKSGRLELGRRPNLIRLALAASLLLLAGIGIWQFYQNRPIEPVFQPRPLVEIYLDTVERGFKPYYECDDPQRFAQVFEMRHKIRLGLADLPSGNRMLGISYLGGLSRKTTAVLCEVENRKVIVFIDNVENDQPNVALAKSEPGLNIFSARKNRLIFYEVSPHPAPQLIDHFVFLD